jgi:hypothetical protein
MAKTIKKETENKKNTANAETLKGFKMSYQKLGMHNIFIYC